MPQEYEKIFFENGFGDELKTEITCAIMDLTEKQCEYVLKEMKKRGFA